MQHDEFCDWHISDSFVKNKLFVLISFKIITTQGDFCKNSFGIQESAKRRGPEYKIRIELKLMTRNVNSFLSSSLDGGKTFLWQPTAT